jgi:hypothetical protein
MPYLAVPPPPGFTPDQQQKIVEALRGKIRPFCSACGLANTYQLLTEGIIYMPVTQPVVNTGGVLYDRSPSPQMYQAPLSYQGRGFPCIALICQNCGQVQFHSVLQLGLGALLGVSPSAPVYGGL